MSMHIGIWLRRAKPACACSRGLVAQAGSRALVAAAVMCGAWHPSCSPPRCSTSGGHEWWPRLLQGEQEIDIEACEAGEAANLFSGAAHRLRLQKVPAAGLQPPVKQAATLCTAPHCPSPCLIGSHRPSPPLQVELPDKRDGKTFSKEEAERAWRSTLDVALIHGSCSKGPGSQCPARAATYHSRSLPR